MMTLAEEHCMQLETCCSCQMLFAVPKAFGARRREDGRDFYCPIGHRQHYKPPSLDVGAAAKPRRPGNGSALSAMRRALAMTQAQVAEQSGVNQNYVSNYELDRRIPPHAVDLLEAWVSRTGALLV